MGFKVDVKVDLKGVPPRIKGMSDKGQYALVNQVHADMDQYVPMLSSDLRNQSSIGIDGKSVYYNVPYARRLFYMPMYNYTTPGTGPRWDNKAKSIHGATWARIVKAAMR